MPHFEFDGEKYAKTSRHQRSWGSRLIERLELQGGEAILDLGCGDGALTAQLADLVPNGTVVGLDASRGMIDAAVAQHQRDNLRFVCMDMLDLDFRELIALPRYAPYFGGFVWPWFMVSREAYTRLMEEAGFARHSVEVELADRHFADTEEMIRWMDQPCLVPFVQRLPPEVADAFREDAIEKMTARAIQADGTCFETFRRLVVTAVKQEAMG